MNSGTEAAPGGRWLAARAGLPFLAQPTMVAGVIPGLIVARGGGVLQERIFGGGVMAVGAGLLLWCVRDFYASGRGTLASWDPPRRLVVVGLYRWSRNPMYLAVLTILLGWCLLAPSLTLLGYAGVVATAFHCRVIWGEEPWLARTFGDDWTAYARSTPRWLLR